MAKSFSSSSRGNNARVGLPSFRVMTKYLQSQHILGPPVYMGLIANGVNVFLNWLLVFHLGYGFDGAPVATSLCRWFQLFLLFGYFVLWRGSSPLIIRAFAIRSTF